MIDENELDEYKEELLNRIHNRIDYTKEIEEQEIHELIGNCLSDLGKRRFIGVREKERLGRELYNAIRKLDLLQDLLEDKEITEIMINGPNSIFIEKKGRIYAWKNHFSSKEKLEDVIQQITAKCNRTVNEANPIVDARLEDGSRVNVVLSPVALNGPILTIRRFPEKVISMKDLVQIGSIPEKVAKWLKILVMAGYNILISGGTGSGKTTFLNALSNYIPKDQRIITIEDSAELQIQNSPNLVSLETRNAVIDDCKPITIRDLIKSSLRMRPDRIIVGEVRGEEALDLLQAMNTGHDGSLSTGHANSAKDMLSRLETMVLMGMNLPLSAIRGQISSGIDIIVHLGRLRDRSRRVLEIVEILGMKNGEICTNTLFSFEEESCQTEKEIKGELVFKKNLTHKEKLLAAGLSDLPVFDA